MPEGDPFGGFLSEIAYNKREAGGGAHGGFGGPAAQGGGLLGPGLGGGSGFGTGSLMSHPALATIYGGQRRWGQGAPGSVPGGNYFSMGTPQGAGGPGGAQPAQGGWLGALGGRVNPQNANGGASAGWNPNDPWGAYSGDTRTNTAGAFDRLFGQAGQAGVFDPGGSSLLLRQIQNYLSAMGGGQERAARMQAQLGAGGDPSLGAYAGLQSGLNAQGGQSQALQQALLQSIMQNQGFLQSLAGGTQGGITQSQLMSDQARHNMDLKTQGNGGLGGILGQALGGLGGGALGGLFGGGGGGGGGQIGGSPGYNPWDPQNFIGPRQ